jgi:hypothetical protein
MSVLRYSIKESFDPASVWSRCLAGVGRPIWKRDGLAACAVGLPVFGAVWLIGGPVLAALDSSSPPVNDTWGTALVALSGCLMIGIWACGALCGAQTKSRMLRHGAFLDALMTPMPARDFLVGLHAAILQWTFFAGAMALVIAAGALLTALVGYGPGHIGGLLCLAPLAGLMAVNFAAGFYLRATMSAVSDVSGYRLLAHSAAVTAGGLYSLIVRGPVIGFMCAAAILALRGSASRWDGWYWFVGLLIAASGIEGVVLWLRLETAEDLWENAERRSIRNFRKAAGIDHWQDY